MSSMPIDPRAWTLRGRLLRLFLYAAAGIWTLSGVLLFYVAERNNSDDADTALCRSGNLLMSMIVHEYQEGSKLEEFNGSRSLDLTGFMVQVWDRNGHLILKSEQAPETRLVPDHEGFHNAHLGALGPWRVVVRKASDAGLELLLAEHEGRRTRESNQLALSLMAPLLLGLPLMGLIAWPFAARAIRPLSAATRSIAERSPTDLRPIPSGELPDEFQPLVDEFNGLLLKLAQALDGERRFAASVAHELRTPLASLRLNTQLLLARSDVARDELEAMAASVERASRTIEQLVALARIEIKEGRDRLASDTVDFARIVNETVRELAPAAERRGLAINVEVDADAAIRTPQIAYLVLRNLLENAIKFARDDGRIAVLARAGSEGWWLQVEDDGPGLVSEPVGDSSERASNSGPAPSSEGLKLGLILVNRAAEIIGAQLTIDRSPALGGARLRFIAHAEDEPDPPR
jgi:signal transduction histidine kinase